MQLHRISNQCHKYLVTYAMHKRSNFLFLNTRSAFNYAKPVSDISETGFVFSSLLHSTGETETGFARNHRNLVETIVHLFTLNYLLSLSLKLRLKLTYNYSTRRILKYFDTRYIGNYERGTFLNLATSLYNFIIKFSVSCRLGNGWLTVLCIRLAH